MRNEKVVFNPVPVSGGRCNDESRITPYMAQIQELSKTHTTEAIYDGLVQVGAIRNISLKLFRDLIKDTVKPHKLSKLDQQGVNLMTDGEFQQALGLFEQSGSSVAELSIAYMQKKGFV